jgi:hypothetical protein
MESKLHEQTRQISASFNQPEPASKLNAETNSRVDKLEALCKRANTSSFEVERVSNGLLLMGIRHRRRTLASRFLGKSSVEWNAKLDGVEESVEQLTSPDLPDNQIWLHTFNATQDEYELLPGTQPLFMWPLDTQYVEELIFGTLTVLSVYNPVYLIDKLRAEGFEVRASGGPRELTIHRQLGNGMFSFGGVEYFIQLITKHLYSEEAVVYMLTSIYTEAKEKGIDPGTIVRLNIQQHFETRPD